MLMSSSDTGPERLRFGLFEVDLAKAELRKQGRKVTLQDQPFRVLTLLLQEPGEIVTREQLRRSLWGPDTFVSFDESLNKAVQKLGRRSTTRLRVLVSSKPYRARGIGSLLLCRRWVQMAAPPGVRGYSATLRLPPMLMIAASVLIAGGIVTPFILQNLTGV